MPRPPIERAVGGVPRVTLFKPAGVPGRDLEQLPLAVDEARGDPARGSGGLESRAGGRCHGRVEADGRSRPGAGKGQGRGGSCRG